MSPLGLTKRNWRSASFTAAGRRIPTARSASLTERQSSSIPLAVKVVCRSRTENPTALRLCQPVMRTVGSEPMFRGKPRGNASRSASAFRPRDSLLEPLPGKIHATPRPPATIFSQGASTQSASLLSIARILDIACLLYPTLWEPLQVDSSAIPIFQPVSTMCPRRSMGNASVRICRGRESLSRICAPDAWAPA